MPEPITVELVLGKETKRTRVYVAPSDDALPVDTLYIQKWGTQLLGNPEKVRVTIEAIS